MEMTDGMLWDSWKREKDANAFAEIIVRHSAMVYATCKRVLANAADAEDAAQECFIHLMGANLKVTASLAPWLHTVATRSAVDMAKTRGRRNLREQNYAKQRTLEDTAAYDDVLSMLDEIVETLPNEQRTVIVERFFHGRKLANIAEECSVAESTVRYRIDKGVKAIRAQLDRRGVTTMTATLGTILATRLAEAAPDTLLASLGKLTLIGVPAKKVSTARFGSSSSLAKIATVAVLLGVIITAMLMRNPNESTVTHPVIAPPTASTPTEPTPPAKAETIPTDSVNSKDTNPIVANLDTSQDTETATEADATDQKKEPVGATLTGLVYDDQGYPVAGATVLSCSWWGLQGQTVSSSSIYRGPGPAKSTTYTVSKTPVMSRVALTDAEGKFRIEDVAFQAPGAPFSGDSILTASAPGFRTVGQRVIFKKRELKENLDFRLGSGVQFNGQLLNENGIPVEDALVEALWLTGGSIPNIIARTDAQGHFQIGFSSPGQAAFMMHSEKEGQALFYRVQVPTDVTQVFTMQPKASLNGIIHWQDGTPASNIQLDISSRYPRGTVEPDYAANVKSWNAFAIGPVATYFSLTDSEGRFAFDKLAPGPDFVITVNGDGDEDERGVTPKLLVEDIGPLAAGEHREWTGTIAGKSNSMKVTGPVTGSITGNPMLFVNVNARNLETEEKSSFSMNGGYDNNPQNKTGIFSLLLTQPGDYILWPSYSHRTIEGMQEAYGKKVTWKSGTTKTIDLQLPDTYTLSWRVLGIDGEPIQNAQIELSSGVFFLDGTTNEAGEYAWSGFIPNSDPNYARVIKKGYVAVYTEATAGEPGASYPIQTVVLHEAGGAEGILVDSDGQPIANVTVWGNFESPDFATVNHNGPNHEPSNSATADALTDAQGRFTFLDPFPALNGHLTVSSGFGDNFSSSTPVEIAIIPGKIIDLGIIQL